MKKIEIKIEPGSNAAKAFKTYLAEKAAFKKAVNTGNVSSFVKQSGKFDSPVSLSK